MQRFGTVSGRLRPGRGSTAT
ncbi:hypothetical protein, partial [Mycobacterium marinum]